MADGFLWQAEDWQHQRTDHDHSKFASTDQAGCAALLDDDEDVSDINISCITPLTSYTHSSNSSPLPSSPEQTTCAGSASLSPASPPSPLSTCDSLPPYQQGAITEYRYKVVVDNLHSQCTIADLASTLAKLLSFEPLAYESVVSDSRYTGRAVRLALASKDQADAILETLNGCDADGHILNARVEKSQVCGLSPISPESTACLTINSGVADEHLRDTSLDLPEALEPAPMVSQCPEGFPARQSASDAQSQIAKAEPHAGPLPEMVKQPSLTISVENTENVMPLMSSAQASGSTSAPEKPVACPTTSIGKSQHPENEVTLPVGRTPTHELQAHKTLSRSLKAIPARCTPAQSSNASNTTEDLNTVNSGFTPRRSTDVATNSMESVQSRSLNGKALPFEPKSVVSATILHSPGKVTQASQTAEGHLKAEAQAFVPASGARISAIPATSTGTLKLSATCAASSSILPFVPPPSTPRSALQASAATFAPSTFTQARFRPRNHNPYATTTEPVPAFVGSNIVGPWLSSATSSPYQLTSSDVPPNAAIFAPQWWNPAIGPGSTSFALGPSDVSQQYPMVTVVRTVVEHHVVGPVPFDPFNYVRFTDEC